MQRTQGVFVAVATAAFVFALGVQTPRANQDGPAAPGASAPGSPAQRPPSPSSPTSPSPGSQSLGQAQAATVAMGELTDVDAKAKTITVKTATSEMKFRYDDSTKIGGAQKGAAGLATMTGQQVTVQYKKDGQTNIASNIDVRSSAAPGAPSPTSPRSPSPDSPGSPDGPGAPRTPGSPRSPSPDSPGSPDGPASPSPRP
jgi:hypothetical protein